MKKWKKYSFWTGLSAAVIMLFTAFGKAFGFSIENKIIEDVIMSVCGVLVALGIVSIPQKEEEQEPKEQENTQEQQKEEDKQDKNE